MLGNKEYKYLNQMLYLFFLIWILNILNVPFDVRGSFLSITTNSLRSGTQNTSKNVLSKISQYKFELTLPCHKFLFRSIFDQYENLAWAQAIWGLRLLELHFAFTSDKQFLPLSVPCFCHKSGWILPWGKQLLKQT